MRDAYVIRLAREQLKIANVVVRWIPINVVHYFIRVQISADMLL